MEYISIFEFLKNDDKFNQIYQECISLEKTISDNLYTASLRTGRVICELLIKKLANSNSKLHKQFFTPDNDGNKPRNELYKIIKGCYKENLIDKPTKEKYFTVKKYGDANAHGEDYYKYDLIACQKVHKLLFELALGCFKYFHDDDLKFDFLDELKYSYNLNKLKPSKFTLKERMEFIDKIYENEINKMNFIDYLNLNKIFIDIKSFKGILRDYSHELINEEGFSRFIESNKYLKENDMSEVLSYFDSSVKIQILNDVREVNQDNLSYIHPYLDDFPQDFTIEYLSNRIGEANEIEKDNYQYILDLAYNFLKEDLEFLTKELETESVIDEDEYGREVEKFKNYEIVKEDFGLKVKQVERSIFLDDEQKAAVGYWGDKPLVVNAGPGSGKTRVIIERVRFLIKKKCEDPSSILVITFTNEATNELRNRLKYETDLDMNVVNQIRISTIHGFCRHLIANYESLPYNYLDRHGERSLFINKHKKELGFTDYSQTHDSDVSIITRLYNEYFNFGLESEDFAHRLKSKNDSKIIQPYKRYVRDFERKYGHFPSFKQIENQGKMYRRAHYFAKWIAIVESYPAYNKLLDEYKSCDDNTLLEKACEILSEVKTPFVNVLIDEFQDTDFHFMEIFKKLRNNAKTFTIVGDSDQSIYGWRGALPHYFDDIIALDNRENIEYVELQTNYRSTANIVDFSEELIKNHRSEGINKVLKAKKQYKTPVYHLNNGFLNEFDNIKYIIKSLFDDNKIKKLSDIAVLFRTNEETVDFAKYLNKNNIPFYLKGNKDLLDRPEIKSILLLFWYLMPYDKTNYVYRSDEFLNFYGFADDENDNYFDLSDKTKKILFDIQYNFERNVIEEAKKIDYTYNSYKQVFNQDIDGIEKIISKIDTFDLADLDDIGLISLGIKNEKDRNFFLKLKEIKSRMFCEDKTRPTSLEVFKDLINLNGFFESISINDSIESIKIRNNLATISRLIKDYENIVDSKDYNGLFDYLNSVLGSYSSYIDESETYENEVHVMTVHKSKGLEYPIIIIASLYDGDFPMEYKTGLWHTDIEFLIHKPDSVSEDKKQHHREEMRMIYVAATRAKELLILSSRAIKPDFITRLKNDNNVEIKNLNQKNVHSLPQIESSNLRSNSTNIPEFNFESIMKDYLLCPYRFKILNDVKFAVEISDDDHVEMVLHRLLNNIHANQDSITYDEIISNIETILKYHNLSFDERDHKIISNVIDYWDLYGKDYEVIEHSFDVSKALKSCDLYGTIDLIVKDDDENYSIVQFIGSDENIVDKNEYVMLLHFYVSALKENEEYKDVKLKNIILHSFYSNSYDIFEINDLYEKYGLRELEKCTSDISNKNFVKNDNCEFCDLNGKFCQKNRY